MKTIECPNCTSMKFPHLLEISKACGKMQCDKCDHIWWECPYGKSCQHRKLTKAEKEANILKYGR